MQVARQLRVERALAVAEHAAGCRRFLDALGDELGRRCAGRQMLDDGLRVVRQQRRQLLGRHREEVDRRLPRRHGQADRADEHELLDRAAVLDGEFRGDEAAHRLADETKLAQLERVEQLDVMQHVVVNLVDRRVVGRRRRSPDGKE